MVILPSAASKKQKGEEGYIFGDKLSTMRIKQLGKFGIETVKMHKVKVEGEERTVFLVFPSNNG